MAETIFRISWLFRMSWRAKEHSRAARRETASQGLARKRWATGTARMAASASVKPERMMRTVLGDKSRRCRSRVAPSMAGMRMSETTTSKEPVSNAFRAASPPRAKSMSQDLRSACIIRRMPSRMRLSSSTKRTRFICPLLSCEQFSCEHLGFGLRFGLEGKMDDEGGALAVLGFEVNRAAMLVDDAGVGDGQSLAGALAHLFRCEKRIENAAAGLFRDAGAGVLDSDFGEVGEIPGANRDLAFPFAAISHHVGDGMGGIDQKIQDDLVELPREARNRGQGR